MKQRSPNIDKRSQRHCLICIFSLFSDAFFDGNHVESSLWTEMRSCFAHLGSLARQFNGSFVVHVLGVSRHFRTTWWTRGTNVRLSRPRREKARASTVLLVSAPRAFSLRSVMQLRSENDHRRILSAYFIGFSSWEFSLRDSIINFWLQLVVNKRA